MNHHKVRNLGSYYSYLRTVVFKYIIVFTNLLGADKFTSSLLLDHDKFDIVQLYHILLMLLVECKAGRCCGIHFVGIVFVFHLMMSR